MLSVNKLQSRLAKLKNGLSRQNRKKNHVKSYSNNVKGVAVVLLKNLTPMNY